MAAQDGIVEDLDVAIALSLEVTSPRIHWVPLDPKVAFSFVPEVRYQIWLIVAIVVDRSADLVAVPAGFANRLALERRAFLAVKQGALNRLSAT